MPEFRQDLISGQWVIIATDRAKRPETFACKGAKEIDRAALPAYKKNCPLCPGNEVMTPPEVLVLTGAAGAHRAPGSAGWRVRVVRNKFPALEPEEKAEGKPSAFPRPDEAYRAVPGYGIHEVIVETPEHNRHPAVWAPEQMALVTEAYYQRLAALEEFPRLRYIQLFRNHGPEAGASIEHPHSQLLALPFVPERAGRELERAHRYYLEHERCPYCLLLEQEGRLNKRIVAENELFTAFMPYASRFPFETWLMPRLHQASFLEQGRAERAAFAALLGEILSRLARALDDPPYNYYLHSAPVRSSELPHFHWHLELVPKLTTAAGFEMGSDVFINTTLPEEAAAFIRDKGRLNNESWKKDLLCNGSAQSSTSGQFK